MTPLRRNPSRFLGSGFPGIDGTGVAPSAHPHNGPLGVLMQRLGYAVTSRKVATGGARCDELDGQATATPETTYPSESSDPLSATTSTSRWVCGRGTGGAPLGSTNV